MLPIYGICFVAGGIFVALAAFAGLDGADFDAEFDTDLALRNDSGRPSGSLLQSARRGLQAFPAFSLKFWTFGGCFFGLTGLLLSVLEADLSPTATLALSLGMGVLCGTATVWILRWLKRQELADSLVRSDDFAGAPGVVELPFDADSRGKVKLQVKGGFVRIQARTRENRPFQPGDRVLAVGLEDNRVWVVSAESLRKDDRPAPVTGSVEVPANPPADATANDPSANAPGSLS